MLLAVREKMSCQIEAVGAADFQNHEKNTKTHTCQGRKAKGKRARFARRRIGNERNGGCGQHESCYLAEFRRTLGKKRIDDRNQRREQAGEGRGQSHLSQRQGLVVEDERHSAEGSGQ